MFIKLICFSDKLEIKSFLLSKSFGEIYKDLIQLLLIDSNNLNNCGFVTNWGLIWFPLLIKIWLYYTKY